MKGKQGALLKAKGVWQGYGVEITLYRDGVLGVLVYDRTVPRHFALAMTSSGKWEIYNPHALPLPPLDRSMADYWGWGELNRWLVLNGTDTDVEVFLKRAPSPQVGLTSPGAEQ